MADQIGLGVGSELSHHDGKLLRQPEVVVVQERDVITRRGLHARVASARDLFIGLADAASGERAQVTMEPEATGGFPLPFMSEESGFLLEGPEDAADTVVLAHGAGAPMDSPFMNRVSAGLASRGIRGGAAVHAALADFHLAHKNGDRR